MSAFDNKWVQEILALQQEDGSWRHFHTPSQPTKQQPMTTEQALRRLRILGLTKDDEPIARTLAYMEHNLLRPHPTVFHEKKHDSKTYGDLMLAAWIRLFDPDNNAALSVAKKWAKVITCALVLPLRTAFIFHCLIRGVKLRTENGIALQGRYDS